jgi:hypothetical protein
MKVRDVIKQVESSSIPPPAETGNRNHQRTPLRGLGPKDRALYTEAGRTKMSKYTVFFERTATGYSAHVPDLLGCIGAASTLDETRELMREAIELSRTDSACGASRSLGVGGHAEARSLKTVLNTPTPTDKGNNAGLAAPPTRSAIRTLQVFFRRSLWERTHTSLPVFRFHPTR